VIGIEPMDVVMWMVWAFFALGCVGCVLMFIEWMEKKRD
jgi:hypothetical protein